MCKSIKILCLSIIITCISIVTCFASPFPRYDIAIGGIGIGTSMDYVKQVYGEPSSISYGYEYPYGDTVTYNYNDLLEITGAIRTGDVYAISCKEKRLSTPGGIAVGMKYGIVKKIYGIGRRLDLNSYFKDDGYKHYEYNYGPRNIVFVVNDGIIRKINIYSGI